MVNTLPLSTLALALGATVRTISLEPLELGWLRAIGLFEGQSVTVLRRALFGGPLQVRTGSGGEFALDRELASRIAVEPSR